MRNDGVVPFQNTTSKGYNLVDDPQFVKPLYLTGMNTFQTGPHPAKLANNVSPGRTNRKQRKCESIQ